MQQIFTIIKVALAKEGNQVLATTEKAFTTAEQAQAYLKGVPVIWDESVSGLECYCERAVHTVILE